MSKLSDTIVALSEDVLHEYYDEFLDEVYGEVNVASLSYSTSDILKEVDPIAYRCGFNDWLDSQCSNKVFYYDDSGEHFHYDDAMEALEES